MEVIDNKLSNLSLNEFRIDDQPNLKQVKKSISVYNSNLKTYCETGRFNNVLNCVNKGANIHTDRDSCLWLASMHGHLPIVHFLIEENDRINGPLFDYKYPLLWSAKNGHLSVLKFLIDNYDKGFINKNPTRYNITKKTKINSKKEIWNLFHCVSMRDYSNVGKKDVIVFLQQNNVKIITDKKFINNYIYKCNNISEDLFGEIEDDLFGEMEIDDDLFGDTMLNINTCSAVISTKQKEKMSLCMK